MVKEVVLKEDKILEKWSVLIQNAQGNGNKVIEKTVRAIEEANVPGVGSEMARVYPDEAPKLLEKKFSKGVDQRGRDYLMTTNENLSTVRFFVGARDVGNNLYVSWYLVCEPKGMDKFLDFFSGEKPDSAKWMPVIKHIFMEEDLTAYTTLIHHCVQSAVEMLMTDLGQDFSKVDRKSKGFMGIS